MWIIMERQFISPEVTVKGFNPYPANMEYRVSY